MSEFDVVSLPDHDVLPVGGTAPDSTRPPVNAKFWEGAALSDLTDNGPVLPVFHTMVGAFPATYVWNGLHDRGVPDEAQTADVSILSSYEHKSFLAECGMDAHLFPDPVVGTAAGYDLEHDLDDMADITEHHPVVFLPDEEQMVQYRRVAAKWPDSPNYEGIADALDDL